MHHRNILKRVLGKDLYLRVNQRRGKGPYFPENHETESIFVHIPKSAGKSMVLALYNRAYVGHYTWQDYRCVDSFAFSTYFKFSVARNPYDRFISAVNYLRQGGNQKDDLWWSRSHSALLADVSKLVDYLTYHPQVWVHFRPQSDFIFDEQDHLMVDFLGRFERLAEDYAVLADRLGRGSQLPVLNSSQGDVRLWSLAPVERHKLATIYQRDFYLLGYQP